MDERLAGGYLTEVLRRGDTVRRRTGPWTPAVHELLAYLRGKGFTDCPEVLGIEGEWEVLTFLPGEVMRYPPTGWFWDASLPFDVGALLRRLHDATTGFVAVSGWASSWPPEGPVEVICHGDYSPTNCLFVEGGRLSSVIDFDCAGPGPRMWDIASAAYRCAPLHAPAHFESWGLPVPSWDVQLERHIRNIRTRSEMAVPLAEGHDRAYEADLGWLGTVRADLLRVTGRVD